VFGVKPPLYLLAMPRSEEEFRRCCDDVRIGSRERHASGWPVRWSRRLATAVPTSVRVFRRQMATPLGAIEPGTPVISSRGRSLGVVRSVVLEIDSGGAAYAVGPDGEDARVMLLPRQALREDDDVAVVDERVVDRLARRSA
jgi:sporulation protein YlmC with PRC-barrel domain